MAVWKKTLAGFEVKIHNVDHLPPHCHAFIEGRDAQIDLRTLEILHPPPHNIPAKLKRRLIQEQDSLLEAWGKVKVIPPGSSPGKW